MASFILPELSSRAFVLFFFFSLFISSCATTIMYSPFHSPFSPLVSPLFLTCFFCVIYLPAVCPTTYYLRTMALACFLLTSLLLFFLCNANECTPTPTPIILLAT